MFCGNERNRSVGRIRYNSQKKRPGNARASLVAEPAFASLRLDSQFLCASQSWRFQVTNSVKFISNRLLSLASLPFALLYRLLTYTVCWLVVSAGAIRAAFFLALLAAPFFLLLCRCFSAQVSQRVWLGIAGSGQYLHFPVSLAIRLAFRLA